MIAALVAAFPLTAGAATQGTIPVGPDGVTGTFDQAGTQAWTVQLQRGRHYAITGATDDFEHVAVRRAGGAVIASFDMAEGNVDGDGSELRAPADGTYLVEVTMPESCFYGTPCLGAGGRGGGYGVSVVRDCPGDASTPCGIAVGQTLHGLRLSYALDQDWYKARLQAGVAYQLVFPYGVGGGALYAAVLDGEGRNLTGWLNGGDPSRFTVPATGTYFVAVGADEGFGDYDITLKTAAQVRHHR